MEEEQEKFQRQFYEILEEVIRKYNRDELNGKRIIGHAINVFMEQLKLDVIQLNFVEFYTKYLQGTLYCESQDFTVSEKLELIKESNLNENDKKLAELYYNNDVNKNKLLDYTIYNDKDTIKLHLERISLELKRTCAKKFKKSIDK